MKSVLGFILTLALALPALAGVRAYNDTTDLKTFESVQCSTGLTCAKNGNKLKISLSSSAAVAPAKSRFSSIWLPTVAADGTSTTPGATTVYLTQIYIPYAVRLTGVAVLNAATVGTDKYIVALFNSSGAALANSALAGTTTSGASVYQAIAFTAVYDVTAPGTYWLALYVNGTTDRFYSIPTIGQAGGLAGSVTGQTFGTVATVTLPTTFTADKGPIAYTY